MKNASVDLSSLPLFIDGSDGSLWLARDAWELILTEADSELAKTRFVRLSDLLELLKQNNISFK